MYRYNRSLFREMLEGPEYEAAFHKFPELPTELREEIWSYCLPHRVCELDVPYDKVVYLRPGESNGPSPCRLDATTHANSRPPLVSRVCRESRSVAFKAGQTTTVDPSDGHSDLDWWTSGTVQPDLWQDPVRDTVHLNWTSTCEAEFSSSGSALACLAWEALHLSGRGSLTVLYLDPEFDWPDRYSQFELAVPLAEQSAEPLDPGKQDELNELFRLPSWLVVVRMIVVHMRYADAAATGLFGLLGDASVQVVDVEDVARFNQYYDLAEACESQHTFTAKQDLQRESPGYWKQRLRASLMKKYHSEQLTAACRPAIMFRLCTAMCNRP